ncbi:MAG: AAA family ATPase, partial [Myxococcales bacterium]|nr:AAA family ATPase [Myxococcales bacterium]
MSEPAPPKDLTPAPAPRELSAADLDLPVELGLAFETTDQVEPLAGPVGQERAVRALELGLGVNGAGYNIFVMGMTGGDKLRRVQALVEERVRAAETPDDWIYLHNFKDGDRPWAVRLPAGEGRAFARDVGNLVARLREHLPEAFKQQTFETEKERLEKKYGAEAEALTRSINEKAAAASFRIARDPAGNIIFVPVKVNGEPMSPQEIEALGEEQQREFAESQQTLAREVRDFVRKKQEVMERVEGEVRQIERDFAASIIGPLFDTLAEQYASDRIRDYLAAAREHLLAHLEPFKETPGEQQPIALPFLAPFAAGDPFLVYRVNVVVDNSETEGAPVVVETAPNYRNLFGTIEKTVDPTGRVSADFTRIRAGSMIRASGGYLIFSLEDALQEPAVYKFLKRALRNARIEIESYDPFAFFTTMTLQPEPIDLATKVIALGSTPLFHLLAAYDDEFDEIFKVPAQIVPDMPRAGELQDAYAREVARVVKAEDLSPFGRDAVEEIVRFGARAAADRERLSANLTSLADLARESVYFAKAEGHGVVGRIDVRRALDERIFRGNWIEERLREMMRTGVLKIDVDGAKVGQVNALAVYDLGTYAFGKPSRVTASVSLGGAGIVNIERESKLSGATHDKGVLILTGYLRGRFAQTHPISLSASLAFEQSYSGIDGDSASSTELYALLSRISGVPIRQDLAVTGSVNQFGEVQAIGGVNEK